MSLVSWVNEEGTRSWIHSSDGLSVDNFFHDWNSLGNIVPMRVINVLSQESDSSLSVIRISQRHVQIINEVDKFELTTLLWTISVTLFDKILFKHCLQVIGVSVVIEINTRVVVIFWMFFSDFLEKTLDQLSLS